MKNVLILATVAMISMISLVGCGEDTGWTKLDDDDPRLETARQQARDTYPEFLKVLKTRKGMETATVEVYYQGTEYISLNVMKADENEITGVVEMYPQKVNLQKGAEVTVSVSELSDWSFINDDGEEFGGYVAAERARLTQGGGG
jgi:uncharacterized protein YegJ (DUF2314 family)